MGTVQCQSEGRICLGPTDLIKNLCQTHHHQLFRQELRDCAWHRAPTGALALKTTPTKTRVPRPLASRSLPNRWHYRSWGRGRGGVGKIRLAVWAGSVCFTLFLTGLPPLSSSSSFCPPPSINSPASSSCTYCPPPPP